MLEFLSARSERQQRGVRCTSARRSRPTTCECIDTLIGDIMPPAELMKTQTDRKIAEELQRTYEVQREAQMQRQELERETAIANMQAEVVRSEQEVRIAERQRAWRWPRPPSGEAAAVEAARRGRGGVAADARRGRGGVDAKVRGDAEASATQRDRYREGRGAPPGGGGDRRRRLHRDAGGERRSPSTR